MKRAAAILFASLALVPAMAQEESRTEYNFLRLPVSAHAAALGGDNVSLVEDDAGMIFNNPALLSSVSDKTISLNYMRYMSGVNHGSAAFTKAVGKRGTWAASAQYLDYGKMKEVDENNVQTGDFSAKDISLAGYFSYMLSNRWAGGVTAKYILSYIGNYNSMGFGVDLGVNYYDPDREWSLSAVVKNLGGQLDAYDDTYERMPIDFQLGVSKGFHNVPLRLHLTLVDMGHLKYKMLNHVVVGLDFTFSQSVWVAMGYNFRRADEMSITSAGDNKDSSHGAGFSVGGGLQLERFKLGVAYGKYHVSSSSLVVSAAYSL